MPSDLRHSLRALLRAKGYAATVILTLALCIAANTTTFAIVHSVLLRPLPIPDAGEIVLMANSYPNAGVADMNQSSTGDYFDRLAGVTALQDQTLFAYQSAALDLGGAVEQIDGMSVTASWFALLRVTPAQGRGFTPAENELGNERKVVLSHSLARQLNVSPGADVRLNGRAYRVTGVMPQGFVFINPDVRYWVPHVFSPEDKIAHHSNNTLNIGRLRPGATVAQVQAQVDAINRANLDRFPEYREAIVNAGFHTRIMPLQDILVRHIRSALYLLWGGAVFVLFIGALNIANLSVARVRSRSRELATRVALGATRFQTWRHIIAENFWLAAAGAGAGLALGSGLLAALGRFGLDRFPRASEVRMDLTTALIAIALAFAAAAFSTLLSLSGGLPTSLREDHRTGARSTRLRRTLVVAEVAFAFILLTGAGLLLASFRNLLNVDPGYATTGVQTLATRAPSSRYPNEPALRALLRRVLSEIRSIPGVTAAGATSAIPLGGNYNDGVLIAETYRMAPGESLISPFNSRITPGYFDAMKMKIVRGRSFDERDNETAPPSVIVDEFLARKFWPGRDPIGQRVYMPSSPDEIKGPGPKTRWLTVVGVVRSIRVDDLSGGRSNGAYYLPYDQNPSNRYTFAVHGNVPHRTIREAIARADRELAVFDIHTMAERSDLSMASRRASMTLALSFASLALFLSGIGLYGVLAYLVALRRREIAIRIALGSSQTAVTSLVLREAATLVASGLAAGIAGSIAIRNLIEQQVYGVRPLDPLVLATGIAALAAIALTACFIPARRAAAVDPARTLAG